MFVLLLAGQLYVRAIDFIYVRMNHFLADLREELKIVSKCFQDNKASVVSVRRQLRETIKKLKDIKPTDFGKWTAVFNKDFVRDTTELEKNELTYPSDEEFEEVEGRVLERQEGLLADTGQYLSKRFESFLSHPVIAAAEVFDVTLWPAAGSVVLETYGEAQIGTLLHHYRLLFAHLGGNAETAKAEWLELKREVADPNKVLSSYIDSEDLFNHLRDKRSVKGKTDDFFHLLLLQLIVDCIAVDTSECERAFALMNRLQGFTRNRMGHFTLHLLMTLCSLGKSCE